MSAELVPNATEWLAVADTFVSQFAQLAAEECDRLERVPTEVIDALRSSGLLGAHLDTRYGGGGCDPLVSGELHRRIGGASASIQGVLNVHQMATRTIERWGSADQREKWLPSLASGNLQAAFALSEPEAGSDIARVTTRADLVGDEWRLSGRKKWITFGQVADLFVLLAAAPQGPLVLLVPRNSSGLEILPITGLLGCRGYMLGELRFDDCRVPVENAIGRPGFGASHVAASGLDAGRYALAWACLGIAEACLDEALAHTRSTSRFGQRLGEHQLVQRALAEMVVKIDATRLLCKEAGELRAQRSPLSIEKTYVAKYFASRSLSAIASDAVQLLGAKGCSAESAVQRYFRDSKIMEIIEGTTELHQIAIAALVTQRSRRPVPNAAAPAVAAAETGASR